MQLNAVKEGGAAATVRRMVSGKDVEGTMASFGIMSKEGGQGKGRAMSPSNAPAVCDAYISRDHREFVCIHTYRPTSIYVFKQ